MEGPYTNPDYGANADTNPWRHGIVEAEYKALVDACGTDVKVWTTAPELDGILDFCAYAKKINPDVVIALGHSEATPQLIDAMGKYRPTLMTYTMNATGRLPVVGGARGYGPDEYCFSHPEMYAELISDSCGIHVNAVLQVYDKVYYTDVDSIQMITKTVPVKLNVPEPHEVPLAKQYKELHESGRDCDIPYTAMELTTVVAEALRICKYEKSPPYLDLNLLGLKIGPVALVGIPGEPFTEVGVKIKETAGFALILPCALTNGYEGYFPVKAAYDEGGYEARSSRYKSGVAETIIEGGKQILSELSHI
jgi:hypothetical protein